MLDDGRYTAKRRLYLYWNDEKAQDSAEGTTLRTQPRCNECKVKIDCNERMPAKCLRAVG